MLRAPEKTSAHRTKRRRPAIERLDGRALPVTLPPGLAAIDVVTSGLGPPAAMAVADDGRVFVAEQAGRVMVVKDGALLPTPFAQIAVDSTGERGLVGIVLDPNFAQNGHVYVYHTTAPGDGLTRNRILRLTAVGDVADPAATRVLFELPPVPREGFTNHNGGALAFGPDGKLYVGVGDQGTSGAAQRLRVLRGKVLRLNPDGSIPRDNPFFRRLRGDARAVYAYGFRNPFTIAVDLPSRRVFVNDVGLKSWEEVDRLTRGGNYGWPLAEGPSTTAGLIPPLHAYRYLGRGGPPWRQGCGIAGGAFVPRGLGWPTPLPGRYLYSDLCRDQIRVVNVATRRVALLGTGFSGNAVDLDFAADGALYRLARVGESGLLTRIAPVTRVPLALSAAHFRE